MPLDSIENKTVAFSLQANCSEWLPLIGEF
jgi:hypothetical protein